LDNKTNACVYVPEGGLVLEDGSAAVLEVELPGAKSTVTPEESIIVVTQVDLSQTLEPAEPDIGSDVHNPISYIVNSNLSGVVWQLPHEELELSRSIM
jgi:hypothetical protein